MTAGAVASGRLAFLLLSNFLHVYHLRHPSQLFIIYSWFIAITLASLQAIQLKRPASLISLKKSAKINPTPLDFFKYQRRLPTLTWCLCPHGGETEWHRVCRSFSWPPADCGSAVRKPFASADGHPESACGTRNNEASESSRQLAGRREECNPSVPLLSLSLFLFFYWQQWGSTPGQTFLWWPIIAC